MCVCQPKHRTHTVKQELSLMTLVRVFCFQTTRIEFDLPEYCVRRRYQDFDWLRMKLEESQPTHLIPVGQEK